MKNILKFSRFFTTQKRIRKSIIPVYYTKQTYTKSYNIFLKPKIKCKLK